MEERTRAIITSLRLRTLPLSLAGVILGVMLAASEYKISGWAALFIFLTTICLQILSNLSNELGDVLRGTDTEDRQGPQYGLDQGLVSIPEMKRLISISATMAAVFGMVMVWVSFGTLFCVKSICLLVLGAAAIWAAMHYTLGKNPYGYRGLGDLFVFIFFGLVSVLGGFFVAAHTISSWWLLLPAAAIGCFSVGVLNVNNIRDMKTDAANRTTVAIKLGERNARRYQTALVCAGWLLLLIFTAFYRFSPWHFLFVVTIPLYVKHLKGIWTLRERALDSMLPLLVISTFILSLILGSTFMIF